QRLRRSRDCIGGARGIASFCPVKSGVIRRTVTRRLARSGPRVGTFKYCSPYPWVVRFSAGTPNCPLSTRATASARRSEKRQIVKLGPHGMSVAFDQRAFARIGGNGSIYGISDHRQALDLLGSNLPRASIERHCVEIDARHPFP